MELKLLSSLSDGKESAYNVGDLGGEEPLEKGKATHPFSAWRIPWTVDPGDYSPWVCKDSDMTE